MSICYNEKTKTITLKTANTVYLMEVGRLDYLYHLYYGPTLLDESLDYRIVEYDRGFSGNPYEALHTRTFSLDAYPQEFSTLQQGDFRMPSIEIINGDGSYSFNGRVKNIEITKGKYTLEGLPGAFAPEGEHVDSLDVTLEDAWTKVQVHLLYAVFEEKDLITRAVRVVNAGEQEVHLKKIMSLCLDFVDGKGFDLISFPGRYGQERSPERQILNHHIHTIASGRGESSHQQNPAIIIADKEVSEDYGVCFGAALVYSGNFLAEVELDQYDQLRVHMGINPKFFDFGLKQGEAFTAPEVLMCCSDKGFTGMTHLFHRVFRENMCVSRFTRAKRPILINTWEAAFFDYNDEKLISIAKEAKKMGVDLLVMDDGWFGKRNDDNSSLGDWVVNSDKIRCGLKSLVEQVNEIGLQFGIWFEPEMVSEDSDLYRAHPDWVLQIPGRPAVRSRNQIVLDLTRTEVQDYIIKSVNNILDSAPISYLKWDINRSITDLFSQALPADRQAELCHRYVLGLYRVLDNIIKTHPDVLFEGCAGGGGRFDAGMLSYFPQYWVSDNTRPIDRLKMQYGTSFFYPISAMGAHVSEANPGMPLHTKAVVAMNGTFGYELDPTKLTDEQIAECVVESQVYRDNQELIFSGDYYRLTNPFKKGNLAAWMFVDRDKEKALVNVVTRKLTVNGPQEFIRLRGLDPSAFYKMEDGELILSGQALMRLGIPIPREVPEHQAFMYTFNKVR